MLDKAQGKSAYAHNSIGGFEVTGDSLLNPTESQIMLPDNKKKSELTSTSHYDSPATIIVQPR